MPPLSTDYVFMSYSRRDDAAMRRIVAFLREQGIKVWVDNEKLIPGTPVWEKEIEKAVQGASAVVVVLSPDSKDSEWVRREISLADQYEKRVFPLLVRGDEKTSISIRLIGRQYVDIRSNEDAGLNYVSATLLRYLEELNEREQNAKKEADRLAEQKIKTEKRLAARKAEEERIALEKVLTDRKAKEDSDRLIALKVDEERIALEKVATERKAKEDADRLTTQKAEFDSKEKLARENTEREAREKLAREKMERDEREKVSRAAKIASTVNKPVVTKPEPKKQSGMKIPLWVLIGFAILALIVWQLSSLPALPKATPTSVKIETPIPAPSLGVGKTEIPLQDGMTLLYVPAGEFLMGSTDGDTLASSDENPQRAVTLDAYWIDQTEVTNKMFSAFVSVTGYQTDAEKAGSSYVYNVSNWAQTNGANWQHPNGPSSDISGKEKHPVTHISWNDATAYCKWANRRLPTEAEWEKAARGADGRIYPWGNDTPNNNFINFDNNIGSTTEVGKYPDGKSIYGAYDMAGNVWEWVNDWYVDTYYQSSPSSNPLGPDIGQYRLIRGGSWGDSNDFTRSANRNRSAPDLTLNNVGFRCARSP